MLSSYSLPCNTEKQGDDLALAPLCQEFDFPEGQGSCVDRLFSASVHAAHVLAGYVHLE